jgi:TRAP-type C4-dicarboxylate transport system permease small subunit
MVKKLQKICSIIDRSFEMIIATTFLLMVLVGGLQVFCRYILGSSLSWSEEFQKYAHIWIIFLAIPMGYKYKAHIGMNILLDKMPKWWQKYFKVFVDLLWLVFGLILVVYTAKIMHFTRMQSSPAMGIRMDMIYFCIMLGGAYIIFLALRKLAVQFFKIRVQPEGKS